MGKPLSCCDRCKKTVFRLIATRPDGTEVYTCIFCGQTKEVKNGKHKD